MIAWPLRFRIHGTTSGFCSVPSLPTAAADGHAEEHLRCVRCSAESASRLAVQLANFATLEVMPVLRIAPFMRDDDGRAVGQRENSERELLDLRDRRSTAEPTTRASNRERSRASPRRASSVERSGAAYRTCLRFPGG